MNEAADLKKAARAAAKERRSAAFALHGDRAGAALADYGLDFLDPGAGAAISGFSSIGEEIDIKPLLARLHGAGHSLALPVMQGKGKPLMFRAWAPGDTMGEAVWGIREPLPSRAEVEPDILLVPLLAFDQAGYRLGYGGGFYDRTIERLKAVKPVVTVGIAYDEQRLDGVPHLDYDQPLDWILTPSGPVRCSR